MFASSANTCFIIIRQNTKSLIQNVQIKLEKTVNSQYLKFNVISLSKNTIISNEIYENMKIN